MKLRHDRRLHPRVPVNGRSGVLLGFPRGAAPIRCRIDVNDVSVEGLRGVVDSSDITEGVRVRLKLRGWRWFDRALHVDGTVVRLGPDASCAIRFAPVRSRVVVGRYVERAGRAAKVPAGRSPAYGWAVARALRLLAADLQRGDGRGPRLIVVTSPDSGDGKSFIAASLALELARSATPVLLVDADLHKPSLHLTFGTSGFPGVAQVFSAAPSEPADACVRLAQSGVALMPAGASGSCPPLSPAGAAAFAAKLRTLGYPIVIIDTPPVLAAAEALTLGRVADEVIVAVRSGHTRDRDMRRALDALARHGAPVRGVVLNDHRDPMRLPGGDPDSALYLDLPDAAADPPVAAAPVEYVRG